MANANEIAKPTRLPWVQGNQIELALPLQIVYFTENGKYIQDYTPQQGDVIEVLLESKCHCYEYTPTIEDGNVLHVVDNGQLCVGSYSVTVVITNETSGKKLRSKWNYVIDVFDDNAKVVDEFDDFPDWGEGAIIDNSVFYFVGTKDIEYITVDTISQLPQEGVIGNIYRVANYDGTQVNPNAYAEYYWNGTQYKLLDVKNYGIDEKPTNGSTNLVESGGTKSLLDEKANKNGYYETLGAGTATNLRAIDAHDNTFKYRKTGGTQSIVSGTASIESIKGNTLAWNQYARELSTTYYYDTTDRFVFSSGTLTIHGRLVNSNPGYYDNTSLKLNSRFTIPANHVIYTGCKCTTFNITTGATTEIGLKIGKMMSGGNYAGRCFIKGVGHYSELFTPTSQINCEVIGYANTHATDTFAPEDTVVIEDVMLIDLTLIYGAGNEPSTPAQFEEDYLRWFGKSLTFEPYDAGSLRDVQMQGLKTTGFNQWDEEWELGAISSNNGLDIETNTQIRSKNYIPALPNVSYYNRGYVLALYEYDSNKEFIRFIGNKVSGSIFTTSSNCKYIRFYRTATTYNHDICINISDTNKNGTYEPYEEHNISVPVTTLTGKVNGQGESVVVFPDGMKGVNDVKDEIKVENGVTKAIKRIGRVDLGSLNWNYLSSLEFFRTRLNDINKAGNVQVGLCVKYVNSVPSGSDIYEKTIDKAINTNGGYIGGAGYVAVRDSSYTDTTTFKTAMSGVYLDYELVEPIEYVVDDFGLPINYKAISGGTEEIIDVDNTIGISPTTLIRYSIDAAKTITNLPIDYQSQESMANLLNALGAAMGGTWTTTFDASTNRYTYSFTPNT